MHALPQYDTDHGVDGNGPYAEVRVFEQTGEFDYYRRVVRGSVGASGATVTYETYDTNFYDTTETDGHVVVTPSGVEHEEGTGYWGGSHENSGERTVVDLDPAGGVGVSREETYFGCGPFTEVSYDPATDPTAPNVAQGDTCA